MKLEIIDFQKLGDERGALIVVEQFKNIPFEIKRVYYMFDTLECVKRGFHAHKKLRQLAIPIKGECTFLMDNGLEKREIILNHASQGLVIEPMIWHEMYNYSPDCILMVLADDFYDESDYIRDYSEFIKQVKANEQAFRE